MILGDEVIPLKIDELPEINCEKINKGTSKCERRLLQVGGMGI